MHVFFAQDISNDLVVLSAEESRHCARVLRARPGQEVVIVDGQGCWCYATVEQSEPRASSVRIIKRINGYRKRDFRLHMAVAPTKSIDRFEWFLEKAAECGIDEITPVFCDRSERRTIKPERLEKILLSGMKQSLRAYLPLLNPATELNMFLQQPRPQLSFIAHCSPGESRGLPEVCRPKNDVLLLIGPEGDFTPVEIKQAADVGFRPISLGEHRLRTETAALVSCIQVNTINGLM